MLAVFRRFAKSWVAVVLLGLLIVSFAIFGISDVFKAGPRNALISAGDRSITPDEYKRAFENERRRLEQQYGQPISTELAVENGIDKRVLDGLMGQVALSELLRKMGIKPSPRLLAEQIEKQPAFFDPITGAFDQAAYQNALSSAGVTPTEYKRELNDQLAQRHLGAGLAAGLTPPRSYAALWVMQAFEERDAGFMVITPANVPAPPAPTDAQLTQFMKENAAQLTRPEQRILSIVRFSPATAGKAIPVSEADIQARYDYRKETASRPETRSLLQIPAKTPAAAQTIAQRLTAGEDPAAVAKAVGVELVAYQDKPKTAIGDRKAANAIFGVAQGQVATIQGDLGLSVVKVTKVTAGHVPTLAELRTEIEAELRQDAAAKAAYEQSAAYDKAHGAGA
ncbi:MAG TPA: SurA N-terminal domain-containing protein, partial [Phenylobacterium sp.]